MTLSAEYSRKYCHWLGKNVIHRIILGMMILQYDNRHILAINLTPWFFLVIRFIHGYGLFVKYCFALAYCAAETVFNLLDIYINFEAPAILNSDNRREFVNKVLNKLHAMWKNVKIVRTKPPRF